MLNVNQDKIKVVWYKCIKSTNKLFTENDEYAVTDKTMLDVKCKKTETHKIFTNACAWYEFSDNTLNGLNDTINILGGNILVKTENETIGKGKMVQYDDLW